MISTLYREKYTRIIKVNPFHDDTTADEKYQFTCSFVFSAIVERINFRDRIVGNVKKHAVPSDTCNFTCDHLMINSYTV